MDVAVSYSNAAPYIRRALIYAAHQAGTARLQREQARARGEVLGLAQALEILRKAEDYADFLPGVIADHNELPRAGLREATLLLGSKRWEQLGFGPAPGSPITHKKERP